MNWKTKGLIQGGLSRLPFGSQCNYFLQRTAGALRSDARVDQTFLGDVPVLFERMARLDLDPASSRILEIGTGWLPILPLSLALAGFRNVVTVDLYPHLRAAAVRRTLLALEKHLDHLCFRYFGSPGQVRENYARLVAANDILSASNITYLAPCNAGATQWPAGSMDLITSNNVFEHVPTAPAATCCTALTAAIITLTPTEPYPRSTTCSSPAANGTAGTIPSSTRTVFARSTSSKWPMIRACASNPPNTSQNRNTWNS
jgi:hypothetical protein